VNYSSTFKVGLIVAFVLGLLDIIFTFVPVGSGGPPLFILIIGLLLGLITCVCAALVWRSNVRAAFWAIVVTRILSSLSAIPAFGADIPSWIKVLVAVQIVVTIVDLVLLLKPNRLVRDQQATTKL